MGYSGQLCQICGVSFNIARVRRPDEPRSAAWVYYGDDYVKAEGTLAQCGRRSGCSMADRSSGEDVFSDPWKGTRRAGGEDSATDAEDEEEDEPDLPEGDDVMDLEHIAGPNCNITNGYSGHRLSLAEMRHCRVWQCLIRKTDPPTFQPAADDQSFERTSNIFRSGLSDNMPETEGRGSVYPIRHDVQSPDATNGMLHSQYINVLECCMPFHPWCLEVFKRASKARMGKVDMDGLWGWYEREADFEIFRKFPRDGLIWKLQQQWWDHKRGTEWVVCNPLFLPGLADALETTISTDPSFDGGRGAFDIPEDQLSKPSTQDPFTALPTELHLMIVNDLTSKAIASLRLASRAFRQLPISLWHHLLKKEMPWFWEASTPNDDLSSYSFWTTTSAKALKENPVDPAERHSVPTPNLLDPTRTNWHKLYLLLKERTDDGKYRALRGLRNRERIWKDCEEIVNRIEGYRARDEIPVTDVRKLVKERYDETVRRNMERSSKRGNGQR